jgi:hypothetical protein
VNILYLLLRLLDPSLNLSEVLHELLLDFLHLGQLHLQPLILLLHLLELAPDYALRLSQCMLQLTQRLLSLSHAAHQGVFIGGLRFGVRVVICKFNFFEIVKLKVFLTPGGQRF